MGAGSWPGSLRCVQTTAFGLYSRTRSRFFHTDQLSLVNKIFFCVANEKK